MCLAYSVALDSAALQICQIHPDALLLPLLGVSVTLVLLWRMRRRPVLLKIPSGHLRSICLPHLASGFFIRDLNQHPDFFMTVSVLSAMHKRPLLMHVHEYEAVKVKGSITMLPISSGDLNINGGKLFHDFYSQSHF